MFASKISTFLNEHLSCANNQCATWSHAPEISSFKSSHPDFHRGFCFCKLAKAKTVMSILTKVTVGIGDTSTSKFSTFFQPLEMSNTYNSNYLLIKGIESAISYCCQAASMQLFSSLQTKLCSYTLWCWRSLRLLVAYILTDFLTELLNTTSTSSWSCHKSQQTSRSWNIGNCGHLKNHYSTWPLLSSLKVLQKSS